MTRWADPASVSIDSLSALRLHPLVAETLIRRGIRSPAEARAFLFPDEIPPAQFERAEEAAQILRAAIRRRRKICVWGDFDVDGQTSTALLVETLRTLGADATYYIPVRGKESHGVHIESLAPILAGGAELILTCDTGVTAHEAIEFANARGAQVIVTDHHDPAETLPPARVILNPKLLLEGHRLKTLAGVGVAYKLAEAILNSESQPRRSEFLLDLVALGLIADVALLQGETRSLAQKGIARLRKTERLGLKVMAELAGANLETLTEETVGFTFAPRLNALGRLSDANPAVELLTTQDPVRARVLAAQIEALNQHRRFLTSQVYEAAEEQLRERPELLDAPVIALAHSGWPGGVVGIVANKLAEKYRKPAILFNETDGLLRGSARSVEGLHITEAIATQKHLLRGFGGHPMAAGLSLEADKLDEFRRGLAKAVEKQLGQIALEEPTLQIDAWLNFDQLNFELADALDALAPFGAGNPSLVLATRGARLKSSSVIGKTREHLRLTVEDEKGSSQSVLWWGGAGENLPEAERKFDLAYSLRASTFRGERQLSLQLLDFRLTEEKPVEIRQAAIQIYDVRLQPLPAFPPGALVWAEGADSKKGVPRNKLKPAETLVVYTAPPSPAELREALNVARPKNVYVCAVPPAEENAEDFLRRLAGLCKYALNHYGGKTRISDLAGAMAARESAVSLGVQWLAAAGHLRAALEDDGSALLQSQGANPDPYLQQEIFIALRGILREAAAFRRRLASAPDLQPFFAAKE